MTQSLVVLAEVFFLLVCLLLLLACPSARDDSAKAPASLEPASLDPTSTPARRAEDVYSPATTDHAWPAQRRLRRSLFADEAYADHRQVTARRLVYRLTAHTVRSKDTETMPMPSMAELNIDVDEHRLRARFSGNGWPFGRPIEVRLRDDQTGVYAFDEKGGRPLASGEMSTWMQDHTMRRRDTMVATLVQLPPVIAQQGPGRLVCALLAEWSSQPREKLERRCGRGGSPLSFRLGSWHGVRTAEVALQLPGTSLRADHRSAPRDITRRLEELSVTTR